MSVRVPSFAVFIHCLLLAAALTAQEPQPRDVLRGTVTDASGQPQAGVTVEVRRNEAQGFNCLDLALAHTTKQVQKLRTGRNGTFAAQLPRGVPFDLHVDDGVHAPIRLREVYAGEDIALQLVAAARVAAKLLDQRGQPCAGGAIEAWDGRHVRWLDGAIDAAGRFESDRLPPGPMTFDIAPATAMHPEWLKLTLEAGVTTPIELVLDPGCVLSGRVVDRGSGKPIAGARVGEGWTMKKFAVTDADGRYEMRGYGASGYGEVRVTAETFGAQLRQLKPADQGVTADFALDPGCEVTGRVLDAAGKPVAGVYLAAVGGGFGSSDNETHDWCSGRTDADGCYRLQGLRLAVAHALMVRAEGAATLVGDMPPLRPGPNRLPDVALRTARYVSGVVVNLSGEPVAGVGVTLRGNNADRATLLGCQQVIDSHAGDYCIAVREMRSDSLGRIHFADVPAGSYKLSLDGDRSTIAIEVSADHDPAPVRLEN